MAVWADLSATSLCVAIANIGVIVVIMADNAVERATFSSTFIGVPVVQPQWRKDMLIC